MSSKGKSRSIPQCVRCRNHGINIKKRGHTKSGCPLKTCECNNCKLLLDRKAIERQIKELEQKEQRDKDEVYKETHEKAVHTSNDKPISINEKLKVDYKPLSSKGLYGYWSCSTDTSVYLNDMGEKEQDQSYDNKDKKVFTDHTIGNILKNDIKGLQIDRQIDERNAVLMYHFRYFVCSNRPYNPN